MLGTLEVIRRYFPKENTKNTYFVELIESSQKVFKIPLYYFIPLKPITHPFINIVETDNFWFVDGRYKLRLIEILLEIIWLPIFAALFSKVIFQLPINVIVFFVLVLIAQEIINYYLQINKGYAIKVYNKSWVEIAEGDKMIGMKIKMPKYSKDSILKHIIKSKILDSFGFTVSSAPLEITYQFKILNQSLKDIDIISSKIV